MTSIAAHIPVVMVFAGNDPTGGAGAQADIEALASMGCHAAPVITAITIQNTQNVKDFTGLSAELVIDQALAVLEDMPVAAFKIGMLGRRDVAEAVYGLIKEYPRIPVVLDPVIAAGGGYALADASLQSTMISLLLPLTTVLTPNSLEARALAPAADTLDACAQQLLDYGCEFVLIKGAHESTPDVVNTLYGDRRRLEAYTWERLPGSYHGSGCTLAASIAGMLAHGVEPATAIYEAQQYTWETLKWGYRLGSGQSLPNRLFWARDREEDELDESSA